MSELFQYKILLVDDTSENLLAHSAILKNSGYHTDTAISGKEALRLLLKNEYGLVILDVQMPEMNGFEVAELMKGNSKTNEIPIIFLSANAIQKEFYAKGHEVGGLDYLTKPVDDTLLILKVRNFLQLHHSSMQLIKANHKLAVKAAFAENAYQELYYSLPQEVFLVNDQGIVSNINRTGQLLCGFNAKDILNEHYTKSPLLAKLFDNNASGLSFEHFFDPKEGKENLFTNMSGSTKRLHILR